MYNVGIIGCGRIASTFEDDAKREHPCTHAGGYSLHPETKIVSAMDTDKKALKQFSSRWNVDNVYTDLDKLLANEKLDIVSVCTPEKTHFDIVMKLAKHDIKAIFCEKPIASNLEQARQMVEACEKSGIKLIINHTRRWNDNYRFVKRIIDSRSIGGVISITGRYTSGLRVMGTHMLDLFRYYCGDVDWVFGTEEEAGVKSLAHSENYTPQDPSVSGLIEFKNGVRGYLEGSVKNDYLLFEVEVFATDGSISIRDNGKTVEIKKKRKSINYTGVNELRPFRVPKIKYRPMMYNAVDNIVECLNKGTECASTGTDGYKALQIIEALKESSESKRLVKI